jgi:competence/damage-inducible protein CinA C-terminal domain
MKEIEDAARLVFNLCLERHLKVATAESCTGGLIAGALTEIAGSSAVFERGFVTYSNEAKMEILGVRAETLDKFGAVSEETVRQMAEGALARSRADIAVSVSGIAGPSGGTPEKPVGLVWFGLAVKGRETLAESHVFPAGRSDVRRATVLHALKMVADAARGTGS